MTPEGKAAITVINRAISRRLLELNGEELPTYVGKVAYSLLDNLTTLLGDHNDAHHVRRT